jgi:HlyD family secretion protein
LNALYGQVTEAQRQLDQVQAGPTQAQLDNANLALQQAQANLDQAQTALDQTGLRAPFDGLVTAVNVDEGALVAPGVQVVEVTDTSPLHLTVQVDEIDVRQIREGMPGQIKLDALPGVLLLATLEHIAVVGSSDQGIVSYDVKVTLNGDDPRVRVGMTAEASVVVQQRSNVLVIPNSYIRFDRQLNRAYVNIIGADGKLQEIEVALGLQGQDRSEITSGLKEGDVIAVDLSSDQLSIFGN